MKKYIALLSMMGVVFVASAMEVYRFSTDEIVLDSNATFSIALTSRDGSKKYSFILVDALTKKKVKVEVKSGKLIVYPIKHCPSQENLIGQLEKSCNAHKLNPIIQTSALKTQPPLENSLLNSTGGKIIGVPGALLALYGAFQGALQTKEYWPKLFTLPFLLTKRTKKKTVKEKTPSPSIS